MRYAESEQAATEGLGFHAMPNFAINCQQEMTPNGTCVSSSFIARIGAIGMPLKVPFILASGLEPLTCRLRILAKQQTYARCSRCLGHSSQLCERIQEHLMPRARKRVPFC